MFKNIYVGLRSSKLEIVEILDTVYRYEKTRIKVRCDCGVIKITSYRAFRESKSCCTGRCNPAFVNIDHCKFNKLTVIEDLLFNQVLVKCDCGNIVKVRKNHLVSGITKSCGSALCKGLLKDLTGQKFGFLSVIRYAPEVKSKGTFWECKCDCGIIKNIGSSQLTRYATRSCGCKSKQLISESQTFPGNESVKVRIIKAYKSSARQRSLEFDLLDNQFYEFLTNKCHYCNSDYSNKLSYNNGEIFHYNGVDRKNPKKGYSLENCVTCYKTCNFAKGTLSYDDFINLIKAIFNNLNLENKNEP